MFLRANRSTDGHSYVEYRADKNVSLIFSSGVTEVNAFNGLWAQVTAVTWHLPVTGLITVGSNILNDLDRQLHIVSMQMRYGNVTVQITSDYRILKIRSELYVVNLKTIVSPFEISIYDHEMTVRCEDERAIVQLLPNSSNIIINTDQYSKVLIDRGREAAILGGREIRPAGNINLLSMQLKILLKSGNISSIHASTNRSQITMASTAAHHAVDIIGGRINLHVFTGNVSMDIVANTHLEPMPTMLTPFLTPPDDFHHNFPIDKRNISSSDIASATQIPLTVTSASVLDETNGFQDRVVSTEGHIDGNIPPFTLSTVRSTGTIGQSPTTVLTSKPLSSAKSTPPSHSENDSHTSSIAEATKTERIDFSTNTFSSPEIKGTTVASIFLPNTSTMTSGASSALRTTYFSPSFLLTAVTSSSPATILTAIPLIPVKTLTSSRISEIIVSSVPVSSRIPQPSSTSTTSVSGDVIEDVVSEMKQPDGENHTDFIEFSWDNIAENGIPTTTTATSIPSTTRADEKVSVTSQQVRRTECFEVELEKQDPCSAWTPFASLPFEFPPTAHYPSTVSFREGNFILQDNEAKSEITFGKNKIPKNKEWNKSALDVPSVSMITAVKEIFDKIMQHGSRRNENPKTEFEQQQNFFSSSKFKRALSTFDNEEMYELQLKIPLNVNLTALDLRRELLLALKKFVLFASLHEGRPPISEDAVRIKITNIERNGDYLKVLFSVIVNAKMNVATNCAQNYAFSGANLLVAAMGILISTLFSASSVFIYRKQCRNFAVRITFCAVFESSLERVISL
ncbi:unnamed protein product [Litomosoides sigmodontis]|uniref:Uncharacterized protein n=1 Tax=Litomosoides sigmodontis TaxID=42156 RepID=A0A3P6S7Y9_LITSI|nr:unnamed protein product [Litomosoides sigmodontis]